MERRRRRKRRRRHGLSDDSKPLSIDMLKKQRHKNAKSKRIASVRLDLDDSGGFSNSVFNRKQLFSKILALALVLVASFAILYDYGFDKISSQITHFTSNLGQRTNPSSTVISDSSTNEVSAAFQEVAQLQGEAPVPGHTPDSDTNTLSTFYPEGSAEAVSRIQLALETAGVGLTSQAMQILDEVQTIDPNVTGLDYIRGTIYRKAGKMDQAREFFLLAKEHKATHFLAHVALGELELAAKNYQAAVDYLAVARKLKLQNRLLASQYSYALRMNRQFQEGFFEAKAALDLAPDMRPIMIIERLAAMQAGAYEPTPEILALVNAPEIDRSASPYNLVIAAGWEQLHGNQAKVAAYWEIIQPHSLTMASLQKLENDPIFAMEPPNPKPPAKMTPNPPDTNSLKAKAPATSQANTSTQVRDDTPAPQLSSENAQDVPEPAPSDFLDLSTLPTVHPDPL